MIIAKIALFQDCWRC